MLFNNIPVIQAMLRSAYQKSLSESCTLPDGWAVHPNDGMTGGFEVSPYDGEEMAERTIEVINGDQMTEVVISHVDMPGRLEAGHMERGEQPEKPYLDVPSSVGVLQFHDPDSEAAIEAVDALADPVVLDELVEKRDFVANEDHLGVLEAVDEVSDVDPDTVDDTLTSI